ncbi:hypothetical protein BU26DRAFT_303876 [Trematosphaeria pertusa]|uniref:Uncharacterized protein n=1 Tax=Trematosphaeria pertusa TaxID=390896 RepID=A0A6A6IGJ4_9PLEO|nr:uncharacterized protein BU26DRAFT_303876 [Trematosphaeria pertusa]KAF2248670.1 hypothetical protein BU26DRAFT_303876 [Trematosphaeria pertusa]
MAHQEITRWRLPPARLAGARVPLMNLRFRPGRAFTHSTVTRHAIYLLLRRLRSLSHSFATVTLFVVFGLLV